VGAFLAVRAAGSGVMDIDGVRAAIAKHEAVSGRPVSRARQLVSWPYEGQQCIDDRFGQPVRAEPLRVGGTVHHLVLPELPVLTGMTLSRTVVSRQVVVGNVVSGSPGMAD